MTVGLASRDAARFSAANLQQISAASSLQRDTDGVTDVKIAYQTSRPLQPRATMLGIAKAEN